MAWTSLSSVVTAAGQWLQLLLLARWLTLEDFGLAAISLTAFGFVAPFTDLGLTKIIVQKDGLRPTEIASFYWLNVFSCLGFFFLFLLIAGPVSCFFQTNELAGLMRLTAVGFLLVPLGSWHNALIIKNLQFDDSARVEIFSVLMSLVLSICAVKMGWGSAALVLGFLGKLFGTSLAGLWLGRELAPVFPQPVFSRKELAENIRFGWQESASRAVTALSLNLDKWVIGRWLGPAELGIYSLVWSIALAPYSKINPIVTKVTWPLFARLQADDHALNDFYQRAQRLIGLLNIPVYALVAATASCFLPLVFGEKWAAGGPVLAILAGFAAWRSLGTVGYNVLLAREKTGVALGWNIFYTIFMAGWLVVCLFFGPTARSAAGGQLVGSLVIGWVWHFQIARFGRIDWRNQLKLAGLLLVFGGLVGLAAVGAGLFFSENNWLKLIAQLAAGGLAGLIFLWKTGDLATFFKKSA